MRQYSTHETRIAPNRTKHCSVNASTPPAIQPSSRLRSVRFKLCFAVTQKMGRSRHCNVPIQHARPYKKHTRMHVCCQVQKLLLTSTTDQVATDRSRAGIANLTAMMCLIMLARVRSPTQHAMSPAVRLYTSFSAGKPEA